MKRGQISDDDSQRIIGPYQIEELLGRGGMGEVYRAYDRRLQRPVALKHIRPEIADTHPRAQHRFRREARAAARLHHASVVQVFDILETDRGDWIVMEWVDGFSVAEMLRGGPLDHALAAALARQVAEGLAAAHEAGILHRDLKTENVMVTATGQAKILDFGLAKPLWPGPEGEEASLSLEGAILGTCRAMSPEQARGLPLDARSDLFSLGVLLYEMVTTVSPFKARTAADTLSQILRHQQPPVTDLEPAIPHPLSQLIDRLLAKAPELRPSSAAEVAEALLENTGASLADLSRPPAAHPGDPFGDEAPTLGPTRPVLRTLLLLDLVDSTTLIEAIGDQRTLEISQRHDRRSRQLIAEYGGLEIDKSDGFLILFERPVDAIRTALAYHQTLRELAEEEDLPLAARAGVHLGEVLLRENPPEDISRGAKPIEVEGIAKATTARVANLAGPHQTLLTRGAFDLSQRAIQTLGSVDGEVRCLHHGPYRFKGLSSPLEIYEVGVAGKAPLTPPAAKRLAFPAPPREVSHPSEADAPPGGRRWRWRWRWVTACFLVVFASAALLGWFGPSPPEQTPSSEVEPSSNPSKLGPSRLDGSNPGQAGSSDGSRNAVPLPSDSVVEASRRGMKLLEGYEIDQNLPEALELFHELTSRQPTSAPAQAGLARAYWRRYELDQRRDDLETGLPPAERAIAENPYLADAWASRGLLRWRLGLLEEAATDLDRALLLDPSNADASLGRGGTHESKNELEAAEAVYQQGLEASPVSFWLQQALGTLFWRQGRFDDAEAAFQRSIELDPSRPWGYRNLASVYHMQGRALEASATLQKGLQARPHPTLYSNLGTFLFFQGQYEEAAEAYRQALKLAPGIGEEIDWANLGDAYRQIPGQESAARDAYRQAIRSLRRKLAENPNNDTSRGRLALYLAKAGECTQAEVELTAMKLPPAQEATAWYRRATAWELCGDRPAALESLAAALAGGIPERRGGAGSRVF